MPMDYLVRIRDERFPLVVTDPADINCAVVLAAAKLIDTDIPGAVPQKGGPPLQAPGTIQRITRVGRKALEDFDRELQRHPRVASRNARKIDVTSPALPRSDIQRTPNIGSAGDAIADE